LTDLISKQEIESKIKQSSIQLAIAASNANESHYVAMAKTARATGDLAQATKYEIQAKQEAIAQLRLKFKLDELMLDYAYKELDAKEKLLNAETEEGRQKLQLIEIEKEQLKIKQLLAGAINDNIKQIEAEITALRNGIGVRTGNVGSLQSDTSGRNSNADAIDKQTSALERQQKVTKKTSDGLETNADGSAKGTFTAIGANPELPGLIAKLRNGTLSSDDLGSAQQAQKNAQDGADWIRSMSSVSPGSVSTEAQTSSQAALTQTRMILEAIQNLQYGGTAKNKTKGLLGGDSGGGNQSSGGGYTVNVNIGGSTQSIKTASQADADALANLLKQLGQSQGRAI
jgi:hypothetical protein